MTKEEKQLIAIEIDKYFRMRTIDAGWFSSHLNPDIKRPDDGFEPQRISKVKISQDSIMSLQKDIYVFSGTAIVRFQDKASQIGCSADVEFAGKAFTLTSDERTWVEDVMLTAFHRTTDIIPEE